MVIPKTRIKPRNLVACSPLMKKGGVHQKSQSALRSQNRQQMLSQLEDWQDDLAFERELKQSITYQDDSDAFFFLASRKGNKTAPHSTRLASTQFYMCRFSPL